MSHRHGPLTVACLVLIALVCIAAVRKFEREHRLLAKLRARRAVDLQAAVPLPDLTEDERDCAYLLAKASVLAILDDRCYIRSTELPRFQRKRMRLALSGAMGALFLAVVIAALLLR